MPAATEAGLSAQTLSLLGNESQTDDHADRSRRVIERPRRTSRVLTHAYLVLYERPDAKDGFQRGFCSSLDQAYAKVDAEMRWLSRHRYTLIEAFIIEVQDITGNINDKK